MRSLLLVVATLVLVVCGFVFYAQMQSPIAPRAVKQQGGTQGPASVPTLGGDPNNVMGPGKDPWVRQFDEQAELKSRFKASRYDRQPSGAVLVERPVAEFMFGRGRFVRIEGKRGSVVMPDTDPDTDVIEGGEMRVPASSPPSRGQLQDVVISLFDDEPPANGQAHEPSMTVAMNNITFDNDTFLITTEAYDDGAGNRVEADQVPVKVRGRDYDFDGRGLRLQWNDLNQRLQLLEIAHGESLRVKDRAQFEGSQDDSPATAPSPSTAGGPQRKKKRKPVAGPTPSRRPIVPYRASFEDGLRITEGDAEIATGTLMQVDFVLEKGSDDAARAAGASQEGAIAAARKAARRPRNPSWATTNATNTPDPATWPSPSLATSPAEPLPIVVYWTGRLRVMPLELSDEPPIGADEQVVRLSGTPLKLYREGANIEAASATFRTADGSAALRSSDAVSLVTLRSADGAVIATPALSYSEETGTATLTGPSRADIPTGAGDASATLSATWNDEAVLSLPKDERGDATIRHADIKGSVVIKHPRMDLGSEALELAFAAATSNELTVAAAATQVTDAQPATRRAGQTPTLEKLIASGGVHATLKDPTGPARSVQARTLEVHTSATPRGEILPRTIIADGDVLLSEPTQSLSADHFMATLKPKPLAEPTTEPTTKPATRATTRRGDDDTPEIVVESITAQGAVRLQDAGGAFASADQLMAAEREGFSEVKLMGNAIVSDGKNTITGPVLTMRPSEQKAEAPGAGTLTLVPEATDGSPGQPIHAAWTGHAMLDGKTNLVALDGGVTFNTIADDGMATSAKGNHLQIALADKPATQSSTQPTTQLAATAATAPTTRPIGGGLNDLQAMDFLADKDARSATLSGDVEIESTLLNADRAVERRMYLRTTEANYDLASRRMIVPVPGRLLYEDHRPVAAPQDEDAESGNRGTTAFEWKRQLTYDDAQRHVVMEGDVDINHVPDAQGGESFRIATQRVTAELEPRSTTPATASATAPDAASTTTSTTSAATQPSPAPSAMRLKRVTADGGVNVRTTRFQFTATTLSYDPPTGLLTARGTADVPVTLTDDAGEIDTSIESLTWNTKTDQISLKRGRGRVRP